MATEELLRQGFAELLESTSSTSRRDHRQHVRVARSFLSETLRRYAEGEAGGSPERCAHLLAVLLKLGTDAQSLQGLLERTAGLFTRAGSSNSVADPVGGGRSPTESEGQRVASDHSSEEEDETAVKLRGYDQLKENLLAVDKNYLAADSSDEEEQEVPPASPGSIHLSPKEPSMADGLPSPALGGASSSGSSSLPLPQSYATADGVRLRAQTLSPVNEDDDQHLARRRQHDFTARPSPLQSPAPSASGSVAMASAGASELEGIEDARGFDGREAEDHVSELPSQQVPWSQGMSASSARPSPARSPASSMRSGWLRNIVQEAAAAATLDFQGLASPAVGSKTPGKSAAAGSSPGPESNPSSPASSGRQRVLQPQQASFASRRLAKETLRGSLFSSGSGYVSEAASDSGANAPNFHPPPRKNRRQPSQHAGSSSSGSQNASDSETGSGALKRQMAFGEAIQEESSTAFKESQEQGRFGAPSPLASALQEAVPSDAEVPVIGPRRSRTHSRVPSWTQSEGVGFSLPASSPASPRVLSRGQTASGAYDTLSVAGSHAPSAMPSMPPSVAPSPFFLSAAVRSDMTAAAGGLQSLGASPVVAGSKTPNNLSTLTPCNSDGALAEQSPPGRETLAVRILNGVSGEEEVRFAAPLEASNSEQHFFTVLDRLCLQHAGQPLTGLNWLSCEGQEGHRFQRRPCDLRMMDELFHVWERSKDTHKGPELLLCTVPSMPPTELAASKVRLKSLAPTRVTCGQAAPTRLQLDTSTKLEESHEYSVAFTHQWTHMTYKAQATLLPNHKGVECTVPWQMMTVSANSNTDGLYDVHLVIDHEWRSENRRALTVGLSESEVDSSSTTKSEGNSFVPIERH
eukprot:TRINITY_DN9332_c0_g1_i1.p1 TRINITY_DN9332_c0_g1~~TRINITY_DN9332_c0_g1_i1.p1  ORF type:complete len:932 (-),score=159.15 TRINITY_DN9332_c0_g1_i1:93-2681(-)